LSIQQKKNLLPQDLRSLPHCLLIAQRSSSIETIDRSQMMTAFRGKARDDMV
jgi:hypothetical protein